jgi:hypothetical protein
VTRRTAFLALAACFLLNGSPCPAQVASDPEIRLPIAVVALGRSPSETEITGMIDAIGAPALFGSELFQALRAADCGAADEPAALEAAHAAALEEFFAGENERATAAWEALSEAVGARPGLLARRPALRRVAFESRLYLALIAKASNDEEGVDRWLAAAAALEDQEPSAADFPPWVRERLARARAALAAGSMGEISFSDAADCELWVDGRRAGVGNGRYEATRGRHAVFGRCGGTKGYVREIEVGNAPVEIGPAILAHIDVVRDGGEMRMEGHEGATDDEIATDLLTMARAIGADRILGIVSRPDAARLLLADEGGILRRRTVRAAGVAGFAQAAESIAVDDAPRGQTTAPAAEPWYRDGLAWSFVATGVAAWGVGLALGQTYGAPSKQESAAWAMMAGGAVLAGAGGVLFFIPTIAPPAGGDAKAGASIGFVGGATF